jgi:hypothetical protein
MVDGGISLFLLVRRLKLTYLLICVIFLGILRKKCYNIVINKKI